MTGRVDVLIFEKVAIKNTALKKLSISTLPFCFFMKFCVARTLWVKLNLDDVLEGLLVVGLKIFFLQNL